MPTTQASTGVSAGRNGNDASRPRTKNTCSPTPALVALDSVGAGVGERVFFVRGREAAFPFYPAEPPTDASIVGIVDYWHVP